jgi:hypothetical protein
VTIDLHTVLHRHDDLLVQPIDDDLVMADIQSGKYFGLTDSARAIWDLLAQPATPAAICDLLVASHSVDRATCENDVLAFLRDLHGEGLVRVGA